MPKGAKMIPYLRTENLKTIPYPAAHTYIAHIGECPPPGGVGRGGGGCWLDVVDFFSFVDVCRKRCMFEGVSEQFFNLW